MPLAQRAVAELIGTFWLVFGGCGSAVLAAAFLSPSPGIGNLGIGHFGVALAFGLTVLTMAYAIGHISGCHLNPAVSIGLCVGRRFPASDVIPYIIAQVIGAIIGAWVIYSYCQRPGRLRPGQKRPGRQWVWRPFARQVFTGSRVGSGNSVNVHVPDDHPRRY